MRVFWALIGVLVLAAAGVLIAGRSESDGLASDTALEPEAGLAIPPIDPGPDAGVDDIGTPPAASDTPIELGQSGGEAGPVALEEVRSVNEPIEGSIDVGASDVDAEALDDAGATPAPDADESVLDEVADGSAVGAEEPEAEATPDVIPSLDDLIETTEAEGDEGATIDESEMSSAAVPSEEPAAVDPLAGLGADIAAAAAAQKLSAPAPTGMAVEEREDGTLLIGGRYVVRGQGTPATPYEIGLDLLVAVQDEYDPRKGKSDLPSWLDRFEGKHVKLTGNMLFPLWAEETDELLLMKNQWDGCCIGVPPTPYDAVEVKLVEAMDLSSMSADYGAVVGRFKVEPYIRSNWLLGLYVMEGARLDSGE